MNYEKGKTYYAITFADPNFTMPAIEPFVFLGKNAFMEIEDDPCDTWQFQDALSYSWEGPISDAEDKLRCDIRLFKKHELGESIVALEELPQVIEKAMKAAEENGFPKISTKRGTRIAIKKERYVQIKDTNK